MTILKQAGRRQLEGRMHSATQTVKNKNGTRRIKHPKTGHKRKLIRAHMHIYMYLLKEYKTLSECFFRFQFRVIHSRS